MLRSWIRFSLICVCATHFGACYDGLHRPGGAGRGGQGKGGGGEGGEKVYGLAIVDVFRPSKEALASPACGNVKASLLGWRTTEMEARVQGVTAQIGALAADLRVIPNEIGENDCADLKTILRRAESALPDPTQISDEIKSKPALHVRLVLWFGDKSPAWPPPSVTANEWADTRRLADLGFTRRLSVNHFALAGMGTGYFSRWRYSSDDNKNFIATVIDDPEPTDNGFNQIMKSVQDSTAQFAEWLKQRSGGL